MVKALGLFSGGLDSILAVKLLQEQEIAVTGVNFVTPFFGPEKAEKTAREIKIPLIIKNITAEHLEILLSPRHGYGAGMNPCIDCHMLMLKIAGKMMEEKGFDFIFTGEVLGERPMSQNKDSIRLVARRSGYQDYILRPLSAKLLEETIPEKEGRVDRSRLLDISGRQRKKQLEMAKRYRLKTVPAPASGCILTDPGFSARLKDLIKAVGKDVTAEEIELLKVGRHVKLDSGNKVIIGRHKADNDIIEGMETPNYILLAPKGTRGPRCLIPKGLKGELLARAVEICASYCSGIEGQEITFFAKRGAPGKVYKTIYSRNNRPKEFIGAN